MPPIADTGNELQRIIDEKRTKRLATSRKLTQDEREAMRRTYAETDVTIADLAHRFGVSYPTAHKIISGK